MVWVDRESLILRHSAPFFQGASSLVSGPDENALRCGGRIKRGLDYI